MHEYSPKWKHIIPSYSRYEDPVIVTGAEGCYLDTQYGKLLDLNSGYWTVILGHRYKEIIDAARQGYFADLFGDVHPSAIELAKDLCQRTGYAKVLFATSGTDAVDSAIRVAWQCSISKYGLEKNGVLVIKRGFHGTSGLTLTASGFPYRKKWLPLGFPVDVIDLWVTRNQISTEAARSKIESTSVDWSRLSGFVFEPILGVGGIRPLNLFAYSAIATKCKKADILLIADEVTTGIGRTGSFLASEQFSPRPDIVCLGKPITNGEFPLSAVLETFFLNLVPKMKQSISVLIVELVVKPEVINVGSKDCCKNSVRS